MAGYKWGIYLKGELMTSHLDTREGYVEAMQDAMTAFEETGMPHEVKHYKLDEHQTEEILTDAKTHD